MNSRSAVMFIPVAIGIAAAVVACSGASATPAPAPPPDAGTNRPPAVGTGGFNGTTGGMPGDGTAGTAPGTGTMDPSGFDAGAGPLTDGDGSAEPPVDDGGTTAVTDGSPRDSGSPTTSPPTTTPPGANPPACVAGDAIAIPNNAADTAVTFTSSACGRIATTTESDFFQFTLPTTATTLNLQYSLGYVSLKISVAGETATIPGASTVPFHPGAVYTVQVTTDHPTPQNYRVVVQF